VVPVPKADRLAGARSCVGLVRLRNSNKISRQRVITTVDFECEQVQADESAEEGVHAKNNSQSHHGLAKPTKCCRVLSCHIKDCLYQRNKRTR
jgi:hypothetical protein